MTRRATSIFVMLAACSGHASPRLQSAPSRTEFILDQLPVRVTFTEPNGLARGDDSCEVFSPWRPEMAAPVLAFIASDLLAKGKRIRHVALAKTAAESVGLGAQLAPDEVAVAMDPKVLMVYDRNQVRTYCMSVLTRGDVWIQLDLYKLQEPEGPSR